MVSGLIGFALVFFSVSAVASPALTGILLIARNRLRKSGAGAERWAAATALAAPPILGMIVTVVLGFHSAEALAARTDHCMDHPHHLHLCWDHGTLWIDSPVAVGFLVFFIVLSMSRAGTVLVAHARARSIVRDLCRIAMPIPEVPRALLVPTGDRFAFTAGLINPVILISRAVWNGLNTEERRALVAHEQGHVDRGDIWKRTVLAILGALSAPGISARNLSIFDSASERLCDRDAARHVGKPSIVAGTILSLARTRHIAPVPAVAAHAAACEVTERIHALFQTNRLEAFNAKRSALFGIAAITGAVFAAICYADHLHHFFETILG